MRELKEFFRVFRRLSDYDAPALFKVEQLSEKRGGDRNPNLCCTLAEF